MNDKVLRITEYNRIIEQLTAHATSDPGRALCSALMPMTKLTDISRAQDETEDALGYVFRSGSISFGGNRDFTPAFRALTIGASLSAPELLHIAAFLENVANVRQYGRGDEEAKAGKRIADKTSDEDNGDTGRATDKRKTETVSDQAGVLYDLFDCLVPMTRLASEIRRCVLSEEDMADDASPELKRIRRSKLQANERIHAQLQKMVNGASSQYLQDTVITTRDGRYCLQVKSENKSQISGIVHDQSSTGSTLFIEPSAVVELSNALRSLEIEENKEIERILADLSAQAGEHLMELKDNAANMTKLDFVFAKAELAVDEDATRPVINDEHHIALRMARHPLIDKKKVVPINIEIGTDYNMVVITGPNTGGKTVTLKTVGLLELMAMAGLHIPAGDKSEISLFREVFADIGDEQSIEQNLSTFSAHMVTIVDILRRADADCLCLLDELGAGTDPTEGAALAISILNFMHTRKIRTLATTHYSELKVYAMRTEGVMNASCEFDVETLQPTYHLIMGVAGKSNAFAISSKLGLPNYIIETAKEQMSQETRNFEDLLGELEDTRRRAEKEKQEAETERAVLERREKQLLDREKKFEERRDEELRRANEQARDILADAKKEADDAISDLRKASRGAYPGAAGGGNADTADMERIRSSLRDKVKTRGAKLQYNTDTVRKGHVKPGDLMIGDRVKIISMGLTGTVSTLPDKKGKLFVQCGIIRTQAQLDDVDLVPEDASGNVLTGAAARAARNGKTNAPVSPDGAGGNNRKSGSKSGVDLDRAANISAEINLLGMTTDEAVMQLDKYLDDARLSHLHAVRVVHGKGTGALRNAVQNYLRKQKWIKSYRPGDFGEGDAGVTIVTLD